MEDNAVTGAVMEEGPKMSFFERVTGIFLEPTKTFADINRLSSWLGIFLILAVMTMAVGYVSSIRIDPEMAMRKAMDASPFKMTEEQKDLAVKAGIARQRNPLFKYGSLVLTPLASLVVYLAIAGVFLLIFVIMGAPLTYKKSLAVTIWGFAPASIVLSIVSVILMFVKAPENIDLTNMVTSNLGPLVDSKAHPVLGSLLASIDIFSLWMIVLLSIGFAAISAKKLTTKKAATGIVMVWALYVLVKLGYRAIFS